MSDRMQVFHCESCGAMSAVLRGGSGVLACCGDPMTLHQDAEIESHLVAPPPPMEFNLSLSTKAVVRLVQNRVAHQTFYFGIPTLKNPLDFWVYQELLWKVRPDVVVEIGNAFGGSTLALAHLLDHIGTGRVIAVDIQHDTFYPAVGTHPRIELITLDATLALPEVRRRIRPGERVMVIEDSDHTYDNTLAVLRAYGPLVTSGSYLIVEDSHCHHGLDYGPVPGAYEAIADFLRECPEFQSDRECEHFFITFNPTGYLKKRDAI